MISTNALCICSTARIAHVWKTHAQQSPQHAHAHTTHKIEHNGTCTTHKYIIIARHRHELDTHSNSMKTSYVWNSCLLIYTHNERNAYTPVKKITEKTGLTANTLHAGWNGHGPTRSTSTRLPTKITYTHEK